MSYGAAWCQLLHRDIAEGSENNFTSDRNNSIDCSHLTRALFTPNILCRGDQAPTRHMTAPNPTFWSTKRSGVDHIPSPDRPKAAKTRAGDTRDNPGPRLHALWVPRGTALSASRPERP